MSWFTAEDLASVWELRGLPEATLERLAASAAEWVETERGAGLESAEVLEVFDPTWRSQLYPRRTPVTEVVSVEAGGSAVEDWRLIATNGGHLYRWATWALDAPIEVTLVGGYEPGLVPSRYLDAARLYAVWLHGATATGGAVRTKLGAVEVDMGAGESPLLRAAINLVGRVPACG